MVLNICILVGGSIPPAGLWDLLLGSGSLVGGDRGLPAQARTCMHSPCFQQACIPPAMLGRAQPPHSASSKEPSHSGWARAWGKGLWVVHTQPTLSPTPATSPTPIIMLTAIQSLFLFCPKWGLKHFLGDQLVCLQSDCPLWRVICWHLACPFSVLPTPQCAGLSTAYLFSIL